MSWASSTRGRAAAPHASPPLLPPATDGVDHVWVDSYRVTSYFAPTTRFGFPDESRGLGRALHRQGIGVTLDRPLGLQVDGVASMLYLDYARKEGEWIPNPTIEPS